MFKRIFLCNSRLLLLNAFFFLSFLGQSKENTLSSGKDVFEDLKELLVRVKSADSADSPKTSYGTGYVVHKEGIFATNYHVISDSVMQPGNQWKIFVEKNNKETLEAELLTFSVVDDLAIIRVKENFDRALVISKNPPLKGERTYSLGLPSDINMSLIEGVYNGLLEYGPYQLVHVTTPLNGGMSGGPTVNDHGQLIGTNVSRILFANDISFIVPKSRLEDLMSNLDIHKAALTKDEAQKLLYSQLEAVQKKLVNDVVSGPTQKVELWKDIQIDVPKFLKCWADGKEEPELPYVYKSRSCRLDHDIFMANGLQSGTFDVSVEVLDASRINRFSVASILGDNFDAKKELGSYFGSRNFGDLDAREVFTSYDCKQGFIKSSFLKKPNELRFNYCIRKYKKAQNLYDVSMQWLDFKNTLKTKVVINHSGVGLEETQKLMAYWMERFK